MERSSKPGGWGVSGCRWMGWGVVCRVRVGMAVPGTGVAVCRGRGAVGVGEKGGPRRGGFRVMDDGGRRGLGVGCVSAVWWDKRFTAPKC